MLGHANAKSIQNRCQSREAKENIRNVIPFSNSNLECQEIDTATEKYDDRLKSIMFMNTGQNGASIIELLPCIC